ncbi:MAG TPA: inorganic phosphate transporter [Spirochaetota bacterium]|nr:inorganic phosphate transporter [Spirochaetota bacterium]
MELYLFMVVMLILLAVFDLVVGVSNDAVNFLNSSIGSKAAPKRVIMLVASVGILLGVTFSSGMMEVARKGIFHPELFLFTEIMVIFVAVMLTDIILLDLYNTFGLPTSTTVSIVFELLGAAVAVSLIKVNASADPHATVAQYINTGKALAIISGILVSVVVAFVCGALFQFFTRLLFTFDYQKRLKRFGAVWGGLALSLITYFIIIKGAKGASFITPEMNIWIKNHTLIIMGAIFCASAVLLQILLMVTRINILKPIVLVGTFALAMAFAANDLVNFIGVPLAGLASYRFALASGEPFAMTMEALKNPVHTKTLLLLLAGVVMVITLWFSKKSRTVTETEISLGRQEEGFERFESSALSRVVVRMVSSIFGVIKAVVPFRMQEAISCRVDPDRCVPVDHGKGKVPSFDLLRASVNLMVASALISFATSLKLPLSTTYVTFMVAMGSSLSDQAWGRESAVYRVTGVLTVIGGWFFTAIMAFAVSFGFAYVLYYFPVTGIVAITALAGFTVWKNHHLHNKRVQDSRGVEVFNIKKVDDAGYAIATSFEQSGFFLQQVNESLEKCFNSLFLQDRAELRKIKRDTKTLQSWANIIIANIFKTLRWLDKKDLKHTKKYAQIISSIQEIAESQRDAVMKSFVHLDNHHKGLLPVQIEELNRLRSIMTELLQKTSMTLMMQHSVDYRSVADRNKTLKRLVDEFDKNQIKRIQDESSKTRLSILFYGLMGSIQKISEHTLNLLSTFNESFHLNNKAKRK